MELRYFGILHPCKEASDPLKHAEMAFLLHLAALTDCPTEICHISRTMEMEMEIKSGQGQGQGEEKNAPPQQKKERTTDLSMASPAR